MTDAAAAAREPTPEQKRLIALLLADLPTEFPARLAAFITIRQEFHHELARQLAPALNAHIQAQPQSTLVDKQHIATWVNGVLRQAGLRIQARGGEPALLVASAKTADDPDGGARYQLEIRGLCDRPRKTSTTYGPLFDLDLMPAPERVEVLSRSARHGRSDGATR